MTDIDMADVRRACAQHRRNRLVLMVTAVAAVAAGLSASLVGVVALACCAAMWVTCWRTPLPTTARMVQHADNAASAAPLLAFVAVGIPAGFVLAATVAVAVGAPVVAAMMAPAAVFIAGFTRWWRAVVLAAVLA